MYKYTWVIYDIGLINLLIFRGKEPFLGGSAAENHDVILQGLTGKTGITKYANHPNYREYEVRYPA